LSIYSPEIDTAANAPSIAEKIESEALKFSGGVAIYVVVLLVIKVRSDPC